MQEYVLGFPILKDSKNVILLRKFKPELKKTFYNGIGGKIIKEDNEGQTSNYIHNSMCKHFKNVTEIDTIPDDWNHYLTMSDNKSYIVYCFRSLIFKYSDFWKENCQIPINTNLEEFHTNNLSLQKHKSDYKILDDIDYIVLMAKNTYINFVTINLDR